MWKCEKCETINDGERCAICGEKKPEIKEPPKKQQAQRTEISRRVYTPPAPEKPSDNKLTIAVLVGIIITLLVAISAFSIFLIIDKNENDEKENTATETTVVTEDSQVTPVPDIVDPDSGFTSGDFVYGIKKKDFDPNPTYTRIINDEYSWYCDIPDNFEQYTYGANPYFKAKDGTAVMRIESKINDNRYTMNEVRSDYLNSMNGNDVLNAKGDDWFAASFIVDGIVYYKKCYVDHYIRSFEIVFPEEYLDMKVYDDYVEHIEANFRRTDVQ